MLGEEEGDGDIKKARMVGGWGRDHGGARGGCEAILVGLVLPGIDAHGVAPVSTEPRTISPILSITSSRA